jgi:large subunit ribosomal protein L15
MAERRITLNTLKPAPGSRKKPKRVGRGPGSGHGKTSTAGHKGQLSRSGRKQYFGFEGGQMPLHRRLPKRGFTNIFKTRMAIVNVGDLEAIEGEITPESLVQAGKLKRLDDGLKVLGGGELKKAIVVRAHRFSRSALAKIAAAGGRAEVITRAAATKSS